MSQNVINLSAHYNTPVDNTIFVIMIAAITWVLCETTAQYIQQNDHRLPLL